MALFQNSVLQKYLKQQDNEVVAKAYKKFSKYFHNPVTQQNIKEIKEEGFQQKFLMELFVNVLGYVINPDPNFNLTTEYKNEKGNKKADGAILKDGNAVGVIELKSTKTKDLEKVRQQAFDYKSNQTGCVYVITSNFEKLRFYINNAVDFEEFDLFTLNLEQFELLYLCLSKEQVFNNLPLKIKEASTQEEETITKKFYADYSLFKRELFRDLVKQNMKNEVFRTELNIEDTERGTKNIKRTLFKKSQKLIDRFLFIFFAEDRGLLPPNSTLKILEQWNKLKELDEVVPLYNRYKKYFNYLDQGRKGTDKVAEIFAYNGGLFKPDAVLDSLLISDDLLYKHTNALSHYDFESQVDVNILGHIFENSLNEIESINAEIEGTDFDKQKTKRKKDGVFYTPKYITKYIVDNTVGKLCKEKKEELNIVEEEFHPKRQKETKKKLLAALEAYREWLLQLTILDPACGSGAFLNQALDFLIKEHQHLDELQTQLLGGGFVFPNIENTVLENNIYGVDLNEESVEIAKLSLWLRTAQPRRKLNNLTSNIKCGNSLIDSKAVAGDKAFKWEEEFPSIFKEKEKKAFHITTATHDSRTSQRMIDYKVRELRDNGSRVKAEGIWLNEEDEVLISQTIADIVKEDELNVMAYNICGDHMHLLLVCEEEEVSKIIQKIKAKTARAVNVEKGITTTREHAPLPLARGEKQNSLWTQKFGCNPITTDEQLWNTVEYIQSNRVKHELTPHNSNNKETSPLEEIIKGMCCSYNQAFRSEPKDGFDVVIGNPPYLRVQGLKTHFENESKYYEKKYKCATRRYDIYSLFMEGSVNLINSEGRVSFILPHKFLVVDAGNGIRKFLSENKVVESIIHFGEEMIFSDASAYTCIISLTRSNDKLHFKNISSSELFSDELYNEIDYSKLNEDNWNLIDDTLTNLIDKISLDNPTIKDVFSLVGAGIDAGVDDIFMMNGKIHNNKFIGFSMRMNQEVELEAEIVKPLLKGEDVKRYESPLPEKYVLYPHYFDGRKTSPLEEESFKKSFPLAYSYLSEFKEEMIARKIRKKTNPKFWYSLHRSRDVLSFENEKIITPEISFGTNMTLDINSNFHNTKVYYLIKNKDIKEDYKYFLGILNSKIMWFYLKSIGYVLRGGYFTFKTKFLEPFPIPKLKNIEEQNPYINKVDLMLSSTKDFQNISNKFTKYLQSQFSIEKLPKKLQNWHELEFVDFIKELNKAIKKAGTSTGSVTKLSKMDEMEWMEVFEAKRAEAQSLKAEIDKTDQEIDQMVYELYGLTEEEIAIVEQS